MLLPQHRSRHGVFPTLPVRENLTMAALYKCRLMRRLPVVSESRQSSLTRSWIDKLAITTRGPRDDIRTLSGGNQQKVLLGRALAADAELIILDEPTIGLDVSTKADLFRLLRNLARDGTAIVIVDSDLEELANIATRILIVHQGMAVEDLGEGPFSETDILQRCFAYLR